MTVFESLAADYRKICAVIYCKERRFSENMRCAVVVAEDVRFFSHVGIDVRAIIRATWNNLMQGALQGASTIEQQLVRTITRRYERTVGRKIREAFLAVLVSSRFSKSLLLNKYIEHAYYGEPCLDAGKLAEILGFRLEDANFRQCLIVAAHLKYPRANLSGSKCSTKVLNRAQYLQSFCVRHIQGIQKSSRPNNRKALKGGIKLVTGRT